MKCPERESASPWPHRLAMMTVGATLLLILAGAVVTETGSGMAVPDWPTTFGYNMFLFPWAKMTGGILYEHSHRLIGSVVGLLTLTLAIGIWAIDQRRWVRWLGAAALGVVVVQGVLGGLRVVLAAEQLALLHGILAHAFLALTVSLAIFTAQGWKSQATAVPDVEVGGFRTWSLLVVATTYLQIILGAIVTHTHGGLTLHVGVAMLLAVLVPLLTLRVCSRFSAWPKLVRPAKWLQLSWMLQMVLGMGSYVMMLGGSQIPASAFLALAFPVLHRLGGGLMLVAGLVLTLQIFRVSRH
ncbi:MAG TPA: COX15/CtaA family protein, partial [Candidatus Acidoferrum sp.]|nr:COX15/CtaA family protein [Candidatus Acidoferrum sp.]